MSLKFKMVAGTDFSAQITIENFTGDLAQMSNIEFVMEKALKPQTDLCGCSGPVTGDLVKTLADGISVVDSNILQIDFVPEDTAELCGEYYFDIRLTTDDGKFYPVRRKDSSLGIAQILVNLLTDEET